MKARWNQQSEQGGVPQHLADEERGKRGQERDKPR